MSSAEDTTAAKSSEQAKVFAWRYDVLVALGYHLDVALELADTSADLHDIEALLELGYTHEQAAAMAGERIDVGDVRKLLLAGCSREIAARVAWPLPTVATR